MESKPREIKIWTVLQISLALLSLITLSELWFSIPAPPAEPDTYYPSFGADLILLLLSFVLVVAFILGIAISLGLWAGKGWAQNWGTVYSIVSLLFGLLWICFNVNIRLSGNPTAPFEDIMLIIGIVYVLVSLPSIYLQTRPRVQDFFKTSVVLRPLMKCPQCGIKYRGHEYCLVCKVKLEPIV